MGFPRAGPRLQSKPNGLTLRPGCVAGIFLDNADVSSSQAFISKRPSTVTRPVLARLAQGADGVWVGLAHAAIEVLPEGNRYTVTDQSSLNTVWVRLATGCRLC
jgi:hypothetical protein